MQPSAKPSTRRSRIGWIVVACLLLAAAACGLAWLTLSDRRLPASPTTVDIVPGSTVADIGSQLRDSGVISSRRLFTLYMRLRRPDGKIQAAEYDFPAHQSLQEIASVLAAGGHPADVWVTIPEGYTARQIAQRLSGAGLQSGRSFLEVVKYTSLQLDTSPSKGLEGFLFPDTYLIPRHASASTVAAMMTQQFRRQLPGAYAQLAHGLGYNVAQVVTIASMVEREAKVDGERRLMAGVYYNRLRLHMPLEVDATIEYALPEHKNALSLRDLKVDSPYNTYRYVGLPPTPIANPGRKSLLAAFYPARTDYLYYVYRGDGRHQFSRTLDEQQAAERKYLR